MSTVRPVTGFIAATLIVIAAAVLRFALGGIGVSIPFLTFYPAVMISGIYGGMRAGLLATMLSALLSHLFFIEPYGLLWVKDTADIVTIIIFISTCILISYISDFMYRSVEKAKEAEGLARLAEERESAAKEIREREERLRLALDSGKLGTWDFDPITGKLDWSERCKEIFGLPPDAQVDFRGFLDRVHPEDLQRVQDASREAMDPSGGGRLDIEYRILLPNGSERWIAASSQAFFDTVDGQRRAVRLLGTVIDITHRMQMEAKLVRANQDWEMTFNSVPDMVAIMDPQYRFVRVNKAMARRLGKSPEECIGLHCFGCMHGTNMPPDFCPHSRMLADGKEHIVEIRDEHLGGNFLLSVTPLLDAQGKLLGTVHIARDITERKQMENELRKSHDELEVRVRERTAELLEANRILQNQAALLDMAHDAIVVRDNNDRVTFWSKGAEELYGFTKEQAVGRPIKDLLQTLFPVPIEQIKEHVHREGYWEGELRHTVMSGEKIIAESRWALQPGPEGAPIGFLEINRDITARKAAEKALKSNMARLELINAELQEFAFVASHDLQEPLRKIQTFGSMLQSAPLDEKKQGYLDRILFSAGRMRQLLDDLLQYSRVAAMPKPLKKMDLAKIAREAADIFEDEVKKTGASIEIRDLPAIEADETQMLQLFQNLIGNALKFRGQAPPRITIAAKCNGHEYCDISVKDNGIGFEQQFAERIFKPFQRLRARDKYEGTGMGLAICRKIVERHGGNIWAESDPRRGSKIIARLPVKQVSWEDM